MSDQKSDWEQIKTGVGSGISESWETVKDTASGLIEGGMALATSSEARNEFIKNLPSIPEQLYKDLKQSGVEEIEAWKQAYENGNITELGVNRATKLGIALVSGKAISKTIKYCIPKKKFSLGNKIKKQLGKRGWDEKSLENTINNPQRTVKTQDVRNVANGGKMNDPATAYINKDGSYVVQNDITGDIVQVSNKLDPNWKSPF